jgi:hypothetical protein
MRWRAGLLAEAALLSLRLCLKPARFHQSINRMQYGIILLGSAFSTLLITEHMCCSDSKAA